MAYGFVNTDIKVIHGDTLIHTFKIEGADLTGASAKAEVRTFGEKRLITTFKTEDQSLSINGQFFTFFKSAADMSGIAVGQYQFDVQFTLQDGVVATLFGGLFKVLDDITE
jgi:hypothetical protein